MYRLFLLALAVIFNDFVGGILTWAGALVARFGKWFSTIPEMFEFLS